ncbi:hypothetical protein C8Q78DRAFT_1082643 [Trametes maxima]|nr:hypothetical protein C8Q78DRAFT_1082643 [Trametes maxima]
MSPFVFQQISPRLPLEVQTEILRCTYTSHLPDLDDVERNEENETNLRQLLIARMLSLGHHRLAAPLPPMILHLKTLERTQEFFEDVWAFEKVFCRCRLSDPASDRPHYNFCQLLGIELVDSWDDRKNEVLARKAHRATPYLTKFRMLSLPLEHHGRGLHLLQCRRWWEGESPIEFLSLVDNTVITPHSRNAWDYIPPYPLVHQPTAGISIAYYQNLHTICISTPTHAGVMSQNTVAFYQHPPEPAHNSVVNYRIWRAHLPSASDNVGWIASERLMVGPWFEDVPSLRRVLLEHRRQEGSSKLGLRNTFIHHRAGEQGRKSLFIMCEDGLVRWQSAYIGRNLDGYHEGGVDLASYHEVNPFTGQLLPLYIDPEYQILEERTPALGDTNPEISGKGIDTCRRRRATSSTMNNLPPEIYAEIGKWVCLPWTHFFETFDAQNPSWQLSLHTVNKTFLTSLVPPFPGSSISIPTTSSLAMLFQTVISYQQQLCQCHFPPPERSHHVPFLAIVSLNFCGHTYHNLELVKTLAPTALPYMTKLQELHILVGALAQGLSLSEIAEWSGYDALYCGPWSESSTWITPLQRFPSLTTLIIADAYFPYFFSPPVTFNVWASDYFEVLRLYVATYPKEMQSAELASLERLYTTIPTLRQIYYQYLATRFPIPGGASFSCLTLAFKSESGHPIVKTGNEARKYARLNPNIHKYLDVRLDIELTNHFPWGADKKGKPWFLKVPMHT